jgi:AhpC/TSA family
VAAPDFALTDISGMKISLSQYRGKVVLLDFWAVACGEIPWYVEFDKKYRDKGLALIGIDMYGKRLDIVKPFMATSRMDYPVAISHPSMKCPSNGLPAPSTAVAKKRSSHRHRVRWPNYRGSYSA